MAAPPSLQGFFSAHKGRAHARGIACSSKSHIVCESCIAVACVCHAGHSASVAAGPVARMRRGRLRSWVLARPAGMPSPCTWHRCGNRRVVAGPSVLWSMCLASEGASCCKPRWRGSTASLCNQRISPASATAISQKQLCGLLDALARNAFLTVEHEDVSFRAHVAECSQLGVGVWL